MQVVFQVLSLLQQQSVFQYLYRLSFDPLSHLSGPSLCATEQCGKCVQPWAHHIQGPGGTLRLHSRPPATDVTGHDRP